MKVKIVCQLMAVLVASVLSACASVGTTMVPKTTQPVNSQPNLSGGLVYYMPKKDFLIKITTSKVSTSKDSTSKDSTSKDSTSKDSTSKDSTSKDSTSKDSASVGSDSEGNVTTVVSTVTEAYPDFSAQYLLTYKFNLFSDSELDLGINERGLLTSAKAKTLSKVNEALQELGKSAGTIAALSAITDAKSCKKEGVYIFIVDKPTEGKTIPICDFQLQITSIDNGSFNQLREVTPNAKQGEIEYGIYYRQLRPYMIKLWNTPTKVGEDDKEAKSTIFHQNIVFTPSHSKTHFLPISRTFFADNEIDFGFTDGMPTKYLQKTNSELVGLFKLPGSLIGGFLDGVTTGFQKISGIKTQEKSITETSTSIELAKYKHEKCIAALAAKDADLIRDNCS